MFIVWDDEPRLQFLLLKAMLVPFLSLTKDGAFVAKHFSVVKSCVCRLHLHRQRCVSV